MRRTGTIGLALTAVAVSVLAGQTIASGATAAKPVKGPPKLAKFDSCRAFNLYAKRHALRRVKPWGLEGAPAARGIGDTTANDGATLSDPSGGAPAPAPAEAPAGDAATVPGQDFSTTNIQEPGVDEPDIVKTDGRYLYAVAGNRLHVIDARAARPQLLASLELPSGWEHELFLHDGHVIALTRTSDVAFAATPAKSLRYSFVGQTTVTSVDVHAPSNPRVVESYSVEGDYLSARLIGSSMRVVTRSPGPLGLEFVFPVDASDATQTETLKTNRAAIAMARSRDWVPRYSHTDARTAQTTQGKSVPCRRIRRAANFAGLGTVTILTFDLTHGLKPVDQDAVMTSGDTVYASTNNVYVATQRWRDAASVSSAQQFRGARTLIHRFSTVGPRSTVYRGAGAVRGFILNQFALSEYEGHLRVASTDAPIWWGRNDSESESFVTALKLERGVMRFAGRVGGLGRGERIFAVRFIGSMGYVVTFRQIDPLYTVDLANPAQPVVRGELKILGFSAYLHPISSTQLIGVGQDATPEGRTIGTQVSLFDVSDPAAPERVDSKTIAGGFSNAEWDQRAFLWWAPANLAVLPVQAFEYTDNVLENWFVGAAGFTIEGSSVDEAGRVTHPTPGAKSLPEPWRTAIRRAVVIGNRLFTLGDNGVGVSDINTLSRTGWVPLPVTLGVTPSIPPID